MNAYTDAELERIGNANSHREAYPDQYSHPLVGKRVAVHASHTHPHTVNARGTVKRVMRSQWGEIVQLVEQEHDNTYWLAQHCREETQ